jgi:hypothetical protein
VLWKYWLQILGTLLAITAEVIRDFVLSVQLLGVIKSIKMRSIGNIASVVIRNAYKILVGKPEAKRPLGDLGVDGDNT